MRSIALLLLILAPTVGLSQESPIRAELRRESDRVSHACAPNFKAIPSCAYTLFTDHPVHVAAGSMPPQNGFALGGAFVWASNSKNWRMSWVTWIGNFERFGYPKRKNGVSTPAGMENVRW